MSTKASHVSMKTTLKIGLVETPISLFKAISDGKGFKWEVADPEGNPISKAAPAAAVAAPVEAADPLGGEGTPDPSSSGAPMGGAVPAAGGEVSPGAADAEAETETPPERRKGIRKEDGAFVDLTEQIEAISERVTLERMEVVSFIDRAHVPRERIIGTYYLGVGEGQGLPPGRLLCLLVEAMRDTHKVAVVRFSKRKGQTLGIITPRRDGTLLLLELCFAEQFREPGKKALAHTHAEVTEDEVKEANGLVEAMAGRRDSLDGIRNLQAALEEELVTRAEAGELDSYELVPDEAVDPETERLGDLLAKSAEVANA